MEIWKEIEGYPDYQVSNFGSVKSMKFNKSILLKLVDNNRGYLQVNLCRNNIIKTIPVHKLVAIAFLNHIPNGYTLVINHKDFNPLNNKLENLEIVTQRENTNQKHLKSSSQYTGVSWCKPLKKWKSTIVIKNKTKHLGYYIDEIEASNAYQNELIKIL